MLPVDSGSAPWLLDEEEFDPLALTDVILAMLSDCSRRNDVSPGPDEEDFSIAESDCSRLSFVVGGMDFKVVGMDSADDRRSFVLENAFSSELRLDILDVELLLEPRLLPIACLL